MTEKTINAVTKSRAEELRNLLRQSADRNRASSFVIEGPHLIERAFESAPRRIKELVFTDEAFAAHPGIAALGQKRNIPSFHVSGKLAERISDTKTPQGIFAVIAMPAKNDQLPEKGVVVALDDVQ